MSLVNLKSWEWVRPFQMVLSEELSQYRQNYHGIEKAIAEASERSGIDIRVVNVGIAVNTLRFDPS